MALAGGLWEVVRSVSGGGGMYQSAWCLGSGRGVRSSLLACVGDLGWKNEQQDNWMEGHVLLDQTPGLELWVQKSVAVVACLCCMQMVVVSPAPSVLCQKHSCLCHELAEYSL